MIIFFTHTHKFKCYKGEYYSTGGITDKVINRYSKYCDKLIVGARSENIFQDNTNKYAKIEDLKFYFSKIDYNFHMFERIMSNVLSSDFIIVRLPSLFGLIAIYYARKYNKPVYAEVVGNAYEALYFHSFKGKLIAFPFHILTKLAIKKANYVSYITEEYLQKIYPTNSKIIANGLANISISDTFYTDSVLKNRISRIKENKEVKLGLIANLSIKYKGHKEALTVFARLCEKYTDLELELVGGGDPKQVESLIKRFNLKDHVRIKGTIPNNQIFNWLDTVDIYLQPSKTEAHGRSVIEAMSRGCTVVTSDIGGMRESISENFRFKQNDLDSFYNILDNTIQNAEIRIKQAYINYENSKRFKSSLIDSNRDNFFSLIIK